ncbi:unnamed protein product [Staurois parvus]|uniref:Uncharacterized protein n=1 Tax=Staurois parvus TaxID=386267 RepID=A0ABN9AV47_9NEOB|nr:unnamed protein product [Staurois parvus]
MASLCSVNPLVCDKLILRCKGLYHIQNTDMASLRCKFLCVRYVIPLLSM